jgi:lipoprotein-releasing system ATP-binding protein
MNFLYKINGLKCSYDKGKRVVLEIDQVEIPAGKTVFIIGASGIGKSTILETLGMMSYTLQMQDGASFLFHDPISEETHNLDQLWNTNDMALSAFRNRHFSFIFQNTHLMGNMTAHENVMMTQLIQGKSMGEARMQTKKVLEFMGMGEIQEKQNINALSGGQKQRLAFCRAIATDFTVLFGDEPTGNLDITNARNLMDILKQMIADKQRSAVIVSHDIDLAIKYADMIIYIRKQYRDINGTDGSEKEAYGIISGESIYTSLGNDKWLNRDVPMTSASLKQHLIQELHQIANLDI